MPIGKVFTCSGGEGSGKSSNIKRILAARPDFKSLVFPGGDNEFGQYVRTVVKSGKYALGSTAVFNLIWANFCDVNEKIMLPGLDKGQSFVLDRFTTDSYPYQGREIFPDPQTFFEHHELMGLPMIDVWAWFDVDPRVGLERRQREGNVDVFDAKDLSFHQMVRDAFAAIYEADIPQISRKIRINANQSEFKVHEDVDRLLLPFLQP